MDRVLLGAIFRKLPLKLLLVILAGVAVFVACTKADFDSPTLLVEYTTKQNDGHYNNNNYDLLCIQNVSCTQTNIFFNFSHGNGSFTTWYGVIDDLLCNPSKDVYFSTNNNCTFRIYGMNYINYTSQQCQTEYNLIPINEVDASYCQSNNLCPASGSPSDCPNVGVSNLFINDVFHPGAFNIIMNIPEEINWDYAYTNSGSNINIDVVGYNQDTEYINGLIDVQNYQPTTDDFTKVFTNFGYFGGLLVACLFVILVFYFIKRLFK